MSMLISRRAMIVGVAAAITALASPDSSRASNIVAPGYDLFQTLPTTFDGIPLVGVPLGSYDFGGGPVSTGTADTIVQRLDQAVGPGTAPAIRIEMIALQLRSATQVDLGAGLDYYYVTLQSLRGGPVSTGLMTITFGSEPSGPPPTQPIHGTFDTSQFTVYFDVRKGALDGTIVSSDSLDLSSTGNPWSHLPPSGARLIDGVNHNLAGAGDPSQDFFPVGILHNGPHPVITAVPEPGTFVLAGLGAPIIWICRSRRRNRTA